MIHNLLLDRYPELFFLLEYGEESHSRHVMTLLHFPAAQTRLGRLCLSEFFTCYVYGPGGDSYYRALEPWLAGNPQRRLIILLRDRIELEVLCAQQSACDLLRHPQVVVRLFSGSASAIQMLVSEFLCDRVQVFNAYARASSRFYTIRLEILRKSTLAHAIAMESLKYPQLLGNILPNLLRWPHSFLANRLEGKFQGVPAIICGAGPSLSHEIEVLKTLENKALLIAGGSTITALHHQGITPHLCVAIDPNPVEFERLEPACSSGAPLIYATRVERRVIEHWQGKIGYLITDTGGPCERYFEKIAAWEHAPIGPEMGIEALSVTTITIALAARMGCNPIILCGVDLAYTDNERYAAGVKESSAMHTERSPQEARSCEQLLRRTDIQGQPVWTLVKWVMESECIARFAKKHPEIEFINASCGGLGFRGIENRSLKDLLTAAPSANLRERLDRCIEEAKCTIARSELMVELDHLAGSLDTLLAQMTRGIEELQRVVKEEKWGHFPTPLFALLESQMQEEVAFECLNQLVGPVLDRLMSRGAPSSVDGPSDPQELRARSTLAKLMAWQPLLEQQSAKIQMVCSGR